MYATVGGIGIPLFFSSSGQIELSVSKRVGLFNKIWLIVLGVEIDQTIIIVFLTNLGPKCVFWVLSGVVGAICYAIIAIVAVIPIAIPHYVAITTNSNR